jgi:cysteine desulfurase
MDPAAMEAFHRLSVEDYANYGSVTHAAGRAVAEEVTAAIASIAQSLNASADELVITSGATESNNLALMGVCLHPRQKRRRIVSVQSEHLAVLGPLERLKSLGFEVVLLPVFPQGHPECGRVDLDVAREAIDESTAIVSVMLANNEIGVIQPLAEIAALCQRWGVPLHTDAVQAVGHLDVDVDQLNVDLLSFSAHKFYGPKGIGGLFVRNRDRRVKLHSQIIGGGQQDNRRSGTLNSPGIVAMAVGLDACDKQAALERPRMEYLRNRLWSGLQNSTDGQVTLNGPPLEPNQRLIRNLNCHWKGVEGQSIMLACPDLCMSSGSACTSSNPAPSHVLQSIGLDVDQVRCSLRFGIGRFNTEQEIDTAAELLSTAFVKLLRLKR